MNTLVILNLLLALGLGLVQAMPNEEEDSGFIRDIEDEISRALQGPRKAVKRVVRDTFLGLGQALPSLEAKIIQNCNSNGGSENLQGIYNDLKTCMRRKEIFITPKSEYLAHVDQCAAKAVSETKKCLPEQKKYFPEFLLDLVKSVVNFFYDDFELLRGEVANCLPNVATFSARLSYMRCLTRTSQQTNDTDEIPNSRASFCQKFIPVSYCFTNLLKDVCDQSTNLDKFRQDYINAMKQPCNKNDLDGPVY